MERKDIRGKLESLIVVDGERYRLGKYGAFSGLTIDIKDDEEPSPVSPVTLFPIREGLLLWRVVNSLSETVTLAPTEFGEYIFEEYLADHEVGLARQFFRTPEEVISLVFPNESYSHIGSVAVPVEANGTFYFGLQRINGIWSPKMFDYKTRALGEISIVYIKS